MQQDLESERALGRISDTLLLLEHPHLFTLGRSASHSDILFSDDELRERSISVHRCDRGGKVTYHGPGQLIGYLIADLKDLRLSVPRFVWCVEEGVRRWLAQEGVSAQRRVGQPGLWCRGEKLVSLGFHIRKGISRHGFAINVQPDLRFFEGIIPCGVQEPVTSLQKLLGRNFCLNESAGQVATQLNSVFSDSVSASVSSS